MDMLLQMAVTVKKYAASSSIGVEPSEFPKDEETAKELSHEQILYLIAFYNDDMYIEPQDDLKTRVEKFLDWARD